AGLELVGLEDLDDAGGISMRDFFFPEDQSRLVEEFFPRVIARGDGEVEVRFRHFQTGAAVWMLYRVFLLTNAAGEQIGLATVSRDISQRRQLEEDLRKLAAELSEANRRKDEFLAMLAHELRNPLAPILNGLQVLRLSKKDSPRDESTVEIMERQVHQMVRLIDDLLDVSRITRGKIELRRERIDLKSIVEHSVEAVRPISDRMGHQLSIALPPQPLLMDGDPTRLSQVVGNLLTNACKFTEPGGRIRITLEENESSGVIRVEDSGLGIDPAQLPRIFDLFTQLDATLEKSQSGLGIGLSLAKTLVEMHGGSIEAHSAGMGQGSEFVVRLPVLSQRTPAAPRETTTEAVATAVPLKILVVDDNRDSAESLALLLRLTGHDVLTAHDGLEAWESASQFKPHVVLLDIGLPKLNGYEVARRIREQPWGRLMILIALTGWGQDEDRRKSQDVGFNGHLVKPVDHASLNQLLSDLVQSGSSAGDAAPG
ncbi:MAG: response regulator, partial [Planctomycetaceae bacterium]|nr:response regulator [Planctomycetaceae bacterium]